MVILRNEQLIVTQRHTLEQLRRLESEGMMKLLVIIPAYNEEQTLEAVLADLRAHVPALDVLVIDDASTDATAQVAVAGGAALIHHDQNRGVGETVQDGIRYGLEHDYDSVVQFDADGQHIASYLPDLMAAKELLGDGIVIGSRYLDADEDKETLKQLAKRIIVRWIHFRTGLDLTDPTSGMRLFGRGAMEYFGKPGNPAPEADTVANLLASGMPWIEVPIQVRPRVAGHSYLAGFKGFQYLCRMCRNIKKV